MIDSYYRATFQKWCVDPVAGWLILSPVAITALGLLFGIGAAFFIALGYPLSALCSLVLSGYCDALDGTLARRRQMSSSFGAICDLVSDRAVEFAVLFALFLVDPVGRAIASMVVFGSMYLCIASFFSVSMFTKGTSEKSFVYSPGLIERAETFIVFALMILMPNFFVVMAWGYGGAVFLTSIVRLCQFSRCEAH